MTDSDGPIWFQLSVLQPPIVINTTSRTIFSQPLGLNPWIKSTKEDTERFVASLVVHKKLAKDTIATIVKELRRVLNHAREHRIILENPAPDLESYTARHPPDMKV